MPEITIPGPEGRIEGRYHHNSDPHSPIAIILHPHPQHGGTMNTKMVYLLYHIFAEQGFSVLRFNFRGVGKSQGRFDDGIGELADTTNCLDWLQQQNPMSKNVWMGGFSFGSWVGLQLMMRRPEISGFVSIGTPASMFDFSFLSPCPSKGLMLHGEKDEIAPVESTSRLYNNLCKQSGVDINYQIIDGADHYFSKHLLNVKNVISDYLQERLKD